MTRDLWHAVALSKELKTRPLPLRFEGGQVVLFRDQNGQAAALIDRCPHRLVPLSGGRVVDGTLQCPYHGWRFDPKGECVEMPGHVDTLPRCRIPGFRVCELDGAIFISQGHPVAPPYSHVLADQPAHIRLVKSTARSTLIDAAENILDATHTHFTHKGLLRGLSTQRVRIKVEVTGGPGWVQACYTGEEQQDGLISKLLDGARARTIGRYRHPGIAELEYWGPKGLVLATTFHLRQADAETVEGVAWLAAPHQGIFGHLKALAFKPLFNIALRQDQKVLAAAFDTARAAPVQPMIGPQDFLRRDITAIMQGSLPAAATAPKIYEMML